MTITAAVDGSALRNPGPAGWCWYVDETCWAAGGWPESTNNRGELTAVIELFKSTRHVAEEHLHILCDSQYVINSVTKWMPGWKRKGWKKRDGKAVLNVDLLQEIDALLQGRSYKFEWVKGHAGHDMNEAADERARAAATAFQRKSPVPSGPGFPGAMPEDDTSSAVSSHGSAGRGVAETSQPEPDLFSQTGSQGGLFDIEEYTSPEALAKQSATMLGRAVARAHSGQERALEVLVRKAHLIPADMMAAFPEDFDPKTGDFTIVGRTAVLACAGEGWQSQTVWNVAEEAELVAHLLAK